MNETEFAKIIDETKKIVLTAVGRHLKPSFYEAIDDVVQETYLRAYRGLTANSFRRNSSVGTWLYVIAKNESLRMNSKLIKTKNESIDNYDWIPAKIEDDGDEIGELYEKISRLPEKYRDVMELISKGLSESAIAEELKIKIGTVKSRSSRGREYLKKLYKEVG